MHFDAKSQSGTSVLAAFCNSLALGIVLASRVRAKYFQNVLSNLQIVKNAPCSTVCKNKDAPRSTTHDELCATTLATGVILSVRYVLASIYVN